MKRAVWRTQPAATTPPPKTYLVRYRYRWCGMVPDEVLCIVFTYLDTKTLLITVPQVCRPWRNLCQELGGVELDFSQFGDQLIPVEALAGWPLQTAPDGGGGDHAATQGCAWKTGACDLFPRAVSATMGLEADFVFDQGVVDAHVVVMATKCTELKHASFGHCSNLTDKALVGLAKNCAGIQHANFSWCKHLTDAALCVLATKCSGLAHVDFRGCRMVTDAGVVALADNCPGLTHACFYACGKLTDAAAIALARRCRRLAHADFGNCANLTDKAVIALAVHCRGLTHANFYDCNLTDAAVCALASNCPKIVSANFNSCWRLTDDAVITLAGKLKRGTPPLPRICSRTLVDCVAARAPGWEEGGDAIQQ